MFRYKTSDGIEFTCSEPIVGGQAAIDIIGRFLTDTTTDRATDSEPPTESTANLIYADFNKKKE